MKYFLVEMKRSEIDLLLFLFVSNKDMKMSLDFMWDSKQSNLFHSSKLYSEFSVEFQWNYSSFILLSICHNIIHHCENYLKNFQKLENLDFYVLFSL